MPKKNDSREKDNADIKKQCIQWLKDNILKVVTSLDEMEIPSTSNQENLMNTEVVRVIYP